MDVDELATQLCSTNGWTVVDDLTDRATGRGRPVLRVRSEHGDGVLRVGVDVAAAAALRRFSGSGVTPAVTAEGQADGQRWMLLEWIDGTPLDPVRIVDDFDDVTVDVAATVRLLHVHPPAPTDHPAVIEAASAVERQLLQVTQMGSTPRLHEIARTLWQPAVQLHGDLLAPNVIRTPGGLRLIDPAGGAGPAEADLGRWVAGYAAVRRHNAGSLDRLVDDVAAAVDTTLTAAPWLDRRRLHAWTAMALCHAALEYAGAGEGWGAYRAVVRVAHLVDERGRQTARPSQVGRNEPCPCGSGRKFKHCHG